MRALLLKDLFKFMKVVEKVGVDVLNVDGDSAEEVGKKILHNIIVNVPKAEKEIYSFMGEFVDNPEELDMKGLRKFIEDFMTVNEPEELLGFFKSALLKKG